MSRPLKTEEMLMRRAAIEKLRADNMLLKEELMLENKFSVQPTTANAAALIATLQDQSDQYTRKVWSCPAGFSSDTLKCHLQQ